MTIAPSRSLTDAVDQAAAILATDPSAAQQEAERILKLKPGDPRALLILGSARRRLGDPAAALKILAPLAKSYPRAAHTRYELGQALAAHRSPTQAIAAFRDAVALKPDLVEAWRALGETLFAEGDNAGAEAAFTVHDRAMIKEPGLQSAADALYAGRLAEAEHSLTTVLTATPDDAAALRLMAETLTRQGRHRAAETLLEHAIRLEPEHDGARFSYANALFLQQKTPEALDALRPLIAKRPKEPVYLNLVAACGSLLGDFDEVITLNETLLAAYPRQPKIWINYGHVLRTVGRRNDAVAAYRQAISVAPSQGEAYWSLANLKADALSSADEMRLHQQLTRPDLEETDRLYLHYALGKSLEDRGEYAAAFGEYASGAKIRRQAADYDPAVLSQQTKRTKALMIPSFFAERATFGVSATDPIFIVGLPRSGSTLVEQILASHSQVEGTMELSDIGIIAADLGWSGGDYPAALVGLDSNQADDLGMLYLRRTRPYRKLPRPRFIDKMPHNFQHVGLIKLILPNARIIDVRRHPLAAGFSAFKQLFDRGLAFTYDLTDLGLYYRDYVETMDHFDHTLPHWTHRVIYEDLVDDPELHVRRLLDYCGLPFEEACLTFYENDRAVRTVSSEQVRRPIFREGVDQWRRFEPYLEPLKASLGDVLERWRGASA